MLNSLNYLSILLLLIQAEGKTVKKAQVSLDDLGEKTWDGPWFPHPPDSHKTKNNTKVPLAGGVVDQGAWNGAWFPHQPNSHDGNKVSWADGVVGRKSGDDEPKLEKNQTNGNSDDSETWNGIWFPHPPDNDRTNHGDQVLLTDSIIKNNIEDYKRKLENDQTESNSYDSERWNGIWFPHPPNSGMTNNEINQHQPNDGNKFDKKGDSTEKSSECDNGKDLIRVDFDPQDKRHSYHFLCIGNRSEYEPNLNTSALLVESFIPAAYQPPIKCLNEIISYDDALPTYGAYRPIAPKFGSYQYLPPQRWLHSLADGAIVLLYHPCGSPNQVKLLQNTLRGCLYRHIITPSQRLSPERPLALLAWGKSLQMSVVDERMVVDFIKANAKLGLKRKQKELKVPTMVYEIGLQAEAHLVTDEQDTEICGYNEI